MSVAEAAPRDRSAEWERTSQRDAVAGGKLAARALGPGVMC